MIRGLLTRDWRLILPLPLLRLAAQPRLLARTWPLLVAGSTLAALWLRVGMWDRFPLREDEALYAGWARTLAEVDPLLLAAWPDKPPLFLWLLAGAIALFGPGEAALRTLNLAASVLTIPITAFAARRLWGTPAAGAVAALLLALNPFAISFAPTVYTDPLLTFCGTTAVALAIAGRPGWAGVALGAAIMTKQQGVFYAPLVLALTLTTPASRRHTWRLLMGCALSVAPALWWDSLRWHVAPSPWDLARRTYAPLLLLPPTEWLGRVRAWASLLWYLGGSWPAWVVLVCAVGAALFQTRRNRAAALLLAWGGAFFLLHAGMSFQVWDRYLLPLAPWPALVASGPIAQALMGTPRVAPRLVVCIALIALAVILTPPALRAAQGGFPIGADHGDHHGLHDVVIWLQTQPGPFVLYHQALGWHFRYYLFDDLRPTSGGDRTEQPPRLDLRWYPSAVYLADNAAKTPYPPAYLVLPDWAPQADLTMHLAWRGLGLEPRLHAGRFQVMAITRLVAPTCDWCLSRPPIFGSGRP